MTNFGLIKKANIMSHLPFTLNRNNIFCPLVVSFLLIPLCLFSQNVGIGTEIPLAKLHVAGNTIVDDSLKTTFLKITNGAGLNKLLQSDASGYASWVNPSSIFSD